MADAQSLQQALLKMAESSTPAQLEAQVAQVPDVAQPTPQPPIEPEVIVPQAQDMYAQGANVGQSLASQLPQVSIPVPQVLSDAGKGIMQGVQAIPGLFSRPSSPQSEPTQSATAPVASTAVIDDVKTATEPTPEEIQSKVIKALEPIKAAKAEIAVADKIQKQQDDDAKKQAQIDAEANDALSKLDNRVRVRSLPEIMTKGSFGDRLGAIIAVTMGGISQGLTGKATNPAIDMIDKLVEQQAQRDKLVQDERQMLRRQALEQAELRIKELEQKSSSDYRKSQLALQRQQIAAEKEATDARLAASVQQKAAQASKFSGFALTPEQEATLTMEERRNAVTLPDGRRVLTQSYEDANEYKKMATEINNAVISLDELQNLGKKGSKFSLKDRAKAESLITKIVGGLRLPYTGPGVLTDNERETLIKTLGNPLAFFSIKSVEMAKLGQVRHDLLANLQNTATVRGIKEQVTPEKFYNVNNKAVPESELVQAYKQKMPTLSDDQIKSAIRKTLPGL